MPICSRCKALKPISGFHKAPDRASGRTSHCRVCRNLSRAVLALKNPEYERTRRKKWRTGNPTAVRAIKKRHYLKHRDKILVMSPTKHRKYRYGLTDEAYKTMLERQAGVCAICNKAQKLCIDHCHKTGVVRGLLCYSCNLGIRMLEGPEELLRLAQEYLKR